ncbi:uncharacterized protein TNCV_746081 [Trichonephila clavipes]|nr:uncharacterized protein TNCV_746081 [Trichonephila clavipes]
MNPGLFWGQMTTLHGCGVALVSGTIPPHFSTSHCPQSWCNGLGAIAYDSRSTLIVMRGILTRQCYVDDILRTHVGLSYMVSQGLFSSKIMLVRIQQELLKNSYVIFRLPWPARYPDLSPVEHFLDQLKQQMPSCHSVHDLELDVQDLWAHLPQDNIRCLINLMLDRVVACIAAGGGPTRY